MNILFNFDQIYYKAENDETMYPVEGALNVLKRLDQNGHGLALNVTKNSEGLVVMSCGVSLLDTMNWLHKKEVNNFNVAVAHPKSVPDLVTMTDLFDGEPIPVLNMWYEINLRLIDKGYIKFTDLT